MTDIKQQVSEILSVIVKYDKMKEYELWLKKIELALAKQNGFIAIEVIRPSDVSAPEYFILQRFESLEDLESWKNSEVLTKLKNESHEFIVKVQFGERQYGTEMFFSRPLGNIYYPKPPFWKQAIVGIITVYPIIILSSTILNPLFNDLPKALSMFFTICIMSPIMITVMPKVSIMFKKWLYPIK